MTSRNQSLAEMQRQLSRHDRTFSIPEIDSITQRSAKRRKIDIGLNWKEIDAMKKGRYSTYFNWPHPAIFCLRMIEAGFFGCNNSDRAICIYCNLICHQWDINLDNPCEVHKTLSPNCLFVKSMSCCHSLQYNKITSTLPSYKDYANPQNRLQSFSSWSSHGFPSIDQLAEAGFFYDGSKLVCFYCNGTINTWQSNNHPIAEHVRCFPNCNYARQLCGERLYDKIQQSLKTDRHVNIGIGESKNIRRPLSTIDLPTLRQRAIERLDLPVSQRLLERKEFEPSIIEQCWMDQLQFKRDDFVDDVDLYIACIVLQKQMEFHGDDERKIIVPRIALEDIYQRRHEPLLNSSNQSYSDILASFGDDHQTYTNARQTSSLRFKEDETVTIEREHSMHDQSNIKPSPRAMTEGGWITYDTENYTSQCPHCHMQYSQWKSDDNPLLIHQYLSPLCPFVLSSDPINPNPATVRKATEQYTDEVIATAELQPYVGLVQTRHGSNSLVSNRQKSFSAFPRNCRVNTDELANNGFSYNHRRRCMQCFYCTRMIFISGRISGFNHCSRQLHPASQCRYVQQLNDHDPVRSIGQASSNNKCTWCLTEDKRVYALPCRHFCLCESCGQIKRLCPKCKINVTAYVIVYPS